LKITRAREKKLEEERNKGKAVSTRRSSFYLDEAPVPKKPPMTLIRLEVEGGPISARILPFAKLA
jgi:hypothetical protein